MKIIHINGRNVGKVNLAKYEDGESLGIFSQFLDNDLTRNPFFKEQQSRRFLVGI